MKISLVCHLLFPGDAFRTVAYPIQTAMHLYWGISNEGHQVQLINASDSLEKVISNLKKFKPDLIFNLAEGFTNSPARQAFYPELFESLKIPYVGGSGRLLSISLDKYYSKHIVSSLGLGVNVPKGNLYFYDISIKKIVKIGKWRERFPVIVKPNFRGDSEGISNKSIVHNQKDLDLRLHETIRKFPEGVLVEQYIEGREIGVSYLSGYGNKDVLHPMELVIGGKLHNPYNVVDFGLKNYAAKTTKINNLSIKLVEDLSISQIRKFQRISKQIFSAFQIKDFCRVDFRFTPQGKIFFLELNPLPSMLDETHMFYAAKKTYKLTYGEVVDHIIGNTAKRYGLRYYKSNKGLFLKMEYKIMRKLYALRYNNIFYKEA